MPSQLRAFLRERGASDAEIARAEADDWLPLLAIDRLLMPGEGRYDVDEVAERAGTDPETARRLWRAMGFPDVAPGVPAFTDRDVEVLRTAVTGVEPLDVANLLRMARVLSSSLSRVAEVEADFIADEMHRLRQSGLDDEQVGTQLLDEIDWSTIQELVDYVHRLQLRAAVWRRLARSDDDTMVDLAIGFADLSGFTALSVELEPQKLGQLVSRWETLAFDTIAEFNARVIKTIGDEVMFAGLPGSVAHAALALVRRASGYPELPPVRAGVAHGPLLARDGDYYGPVVNLASRLTDIARRGTVLAPEQMHQALKADKSLSWEPIGTRHVRGMGDVMVYELHENS
ncbi:MAG: pH-sensitive adenylate cyclase [Actinomycetia bacterium]|nr:pH-sensitive adenylate cyclase [Actinomycetes bacterium]